MHPDLLEELLMRSALRGGLPCPSRQPAPFRVADQVAVPSGPFPSAITPFASCRWKLRSSTPLLLVTAPLAVSRIQLRMSLLPKAAALGEARSADTTEGGRPQARER